MAERDGDTVSPERGVYLIDLDAQGHARGAARAASRRTWRPKRRCAPRASACSRRSPPPSRRSSPSASVGRIYGYEKALFDFDSKHITQPGNKLASSLPVRDLQVVRLRAGVSVVRAHAKRARRPDRQRRRHAERHGQPRARLRRQQPLRLGRDRPGRRRRLVGNGGAARDGADPGRAPAAGDDRLRVVHRRGSGAARQPRVRAPRGRRQAAASSARSTTT